MWHWPSPLDGEKEKLVKFTVQKDQAVALIDLSVELSLLYLVGDPDDQVILWKKLTDRFHKKTGQTSYSSRKGYILWLWEDELVQERIQKLREISDELTVNASLLEAKIRFFKF